ncbi:hypothetical protein [Megasphaera elsdenii]|uniref:hypothetical protein n=1 Tax=Megasphaera elsdenii TaxID=907 RepID=UPI00242A8220|nr:hypothetical protein [Megasphaera elsdenii]
MQPFWPLLIDYEGEDGFQTDRGVVVGIDAHVVAAQVLAMLFLVVVGVMVLKTQLIQLKIQFFCLFTIYFQL